MEKASQDLMHEHELILVALDVIEKMVENVKSNKGSDIDDIERVIGFLKVFADKCHHGKEEEYLFPAMEEAGVQKQNGPIGIMLEQHRKGRELVKQMERSITNRILDEETFAESATAYVSLLRYHIDKEDNLFFPLCDEKLTEQKQKELLRNFEEIEKNVIGVGVHEELHTLLGRFSKKYLS